MKLIKCIFAVGFIMLLAGATGAAAATMQEQDGSGQQELVFDSCNDIKAMAGEKPSVTVGGGSITFTTHIACGDFVGMEFAGDTVIKSPGGISTSNLLFIAAPEVRVVFSAPTVILERAAELRAINVPILWGMGFFEFETTDEHPASAAGALEDKHGVIHMPDGGSVHSSQQLAYTERAIIASRPPTIKASDPDQPGSMFPDDSYLLRMLTAEHLRMSINAGDHAEEDASSSDEPRRVPQTNSWTSIRQQQRNVGRRDTGSPGARSDPSTAEEGQQQFSDTWTRKNGRSSRDTGSPGARPDPSTAEEGQQQFSNAWTRKDGRSSSGSSSSEQGFDNGKGDSRKRFGGGSGGRSSTTINDMSLPPEITAHPKRFLEDGDSMTGVLIYEDNRSAVSVSYVDGSVRHMKVVGNPARDAEGKQTGPVPISVTTLLRSDLSKVMEVHQRRWEIVEEDKAKASGTKKSKVGQLEQRLREQARAHLGEVVLTFSDRGVVEVTMDGTTVLKEGGPSLMGYRKKGPHKFRPTRHGFEVFRRGKLIWPVSGDGNEDYGVP